MTRRLIAGLMFLLALAIVGPRAIPESVAAGQAADFKIKQDVPREALEKEELEEGKVDIAVDETDDKPFTLNITPKKVLGFIVGTALTVFFVFFVFSCIPYEMLRRRSEKEKRVESKKNISSIIKPHDET